ncbi:MAG: hypothetical protein PHU44_06470 [Syntrophales bacterium]|nr:hypothetical protein [Syntrophales bacterium]MDD5641278.1 hypothetical protein [Syntrophales bacterium]
MDFIYPDLDWYTGISKLEMVPPRCPYANVHRCPRYYHSIYLLGEAGIATKIRPEKVKELDTFWSNTDLLPVVGEHDTSITGGGDKKTGFSNFCPEISFDVFGLFADYLSRYADGIDMGIAHKQLAEVAYPKDWRWQWETISPLHYVKCSLYSQLISRPSETTKDNINLRSSQELLEIKPGLAGISLNLKVLLTRLAKWWLSK